MVLHFRTKIRLCEIIIYEPSAKRYFSRMSALFEARATKERVRHLREGVASKFVQYFLKRTECLICRVPFVNR
jgi:hypothetical protein